MPAQTQTLRPLRQRCATITPNSGDPGRGLRQRCADVERAGVVASLATGTRAGVALDAAPLPATDFLLADFAGSGLRRGDGDQHVVAGR